MRFDECIEFAIKNPVAWVATDDNGQPRVRPLGMLFADKTGFYFQTWTIKEIWTQIYNNPKIEIGFIGEDMGKVLRIAGEAERVDDPALMQKAIDDRPFLARMELTADSPELVIFRIAKGEAYFWTMETNLDPKKKIVFGD